MISSNYIPNSSIPKEILSCDLCNSSTHKSEKKRFYFSSSSDFHNHLREAHCTKEGGSFVCLYGPNNVCPSLPIDGVSELDYKKHVSKVHFGGESSFDHPASITMNSDSSEEKWTVLSSTVNLAALLNNPRLAKRETDFFTKTWGESFARSSMTSSSHIPHISMDYFKEFIHKTSAKRKNYKVLNENLAPKKIDEILSFRVHNEEQKIPKIFFSSEFDLTNPDTFNTVLPWNSITNKYAQQQITPYNTSPKQTNDTNMATAQNPFMTESVSEKQKRQFEVKPLQSSKILQEKLSHYLDHIEMQIGSQICLKSESFFQTMLSHNALQRYLENLCKTVHFLREKMRKTKEGMVDLPMGILKKALLKNQYINLLEKLKLMATVQQTQPTIQLLLGTNDFSGSLDLISTTHEVLSQELSGLHCFRHFGPQLLELEKVIVRMIEEEYTYFLTNFLNQPINHSHIRLPLAPSTPTFPSFLTSLTPTDDANEIDEEKLVLIALGLFRHNNTDYITVLNNEACTTVRTLIKQTVIEVVSSMEQTEAENKLTAQMRQLQQQDWLLLVSKLFHVLIVVLLRLKSITDIMILMASKLVYECEDGGCANEQNNNYNNNRNNITNNNHKNNDNINSKNTQRLNNSIQIDKFNHNVISQQVNTPTDSQQNSQCDLNNENNYNKSIPFNSNNLNNVNNVNPNFSNKILSNKNVSNNNNFSNNNNNLFNTSESDLLEFMSDNDPTMLIEAPEQQQQLPSQQHQPPSQQQHYNTNPFDPILTTTTYTDNSTNNYANSIIKESLNDSNYLSDDSGDDSKYKSDIDNFLEKQSTNRSRPDKDDKIDSSDNLSSFLPSDINDGGNREVENDGDNDDDGEKFLTARVNNGNDLKAREIHDDDDDNEDGSDDDGDCWRRNVSSMIKDCETVLTTTESSRIITQLKETLAQIFEFTNQRSFKLFVARDKGDYLDKLSVDDFLELKGCVEWYVRVGEKVVGRKCSPLLVGHLQNQAVKFVNKFHEEKKSKLCLILDNERWKQADVPFEFQHLVDHLVSSNQMSLPPKVSDPGNKGKEHLNVAGEKFVVVGTVLILLKLMVEYCEFVDQFPCMASEVLTKLVELLKNFNSRTCQLILGAGALQLVGLKTINTINLGLASRCLQLVVSFLPRIKSHFQSRLSSLSSSSSSASSAKQQSLKHMDHLTKDYNDHISEISVKMVSIMDQVLLKHISKYDVKNLSSSSQPSVIFEAISKQTLRFIEATTDLLPQYQMESIVNQFHHNFTINLKKHLTSVAFNPHHQHTTNCVERDLKYYCSVIKQVPGFNDLKIIVQDIFNS